MMDWLHAFIILGLVILIWRSAADLYRAAREIQRRDRA